MQARQQQRTGNRCAAASACAGPSPPTQRAQTPIWSYWSLRRQTATAASTLRLLQRRLPRPSCRAYRAAAIRSRLCCLCWPSRATCPPPHSLPPFLALGPSSTVSIVLPLWTHAHRMCIAAVHPLGGGGTWVCTRACLGCRQPSTASSASSKLCLAFQLVTVVLCSPNSPFQPITSRTSSRC